MGAWLRIVVPGSACSKQAKTICCALLMANVLYVSMCFAVGFEVKFELRVQWLRADGSWLSVK